MTTIWKYEADAMENLAGKAISGQGYFGMSQYSINPKHNSPSVSESGKLRCVLPNTKPSEAAFLTPVQNQYLRSGQCIFGKLYTIALEFEAIHDPATDPRKTTFLRLWGPGYHRQGNWKPVLNLSLSGDDILAEWYFGDMMGNGPSKKARIGKYDGPVSVSVDYMAHLRRGAMRLSVNGQETLTKAVRGCRTAFEQCPAGPLVFVGASGVSNETGVSGFAYSSVKIDVS